MNSIVEKVLSSGLIDRSMAELMEKYQLLPEGAAEQVKDATREQMTKIVNEVVELSEKDHIVKETRFDLERLRWPARIHTSMPSTPNKQHSPWLDVVVDRMGRYYVRMQDFKEEWFIPGFLLYPSGQPVQEILEVQKLFIDETPVCVQIATREV